ncbi:MAG: amidohydrolase family protein [Nitrospirae bacterium]|nr:amidohydrolase family protein [Nitrospirota bacterium]
MKIIDIHTHGIGGYDTRTTAEGDILKIAGIHGSYGISEIILSVYSAPIPIMRENMDTVRKAMEMQDVEPAKIIGVHLEGPFLNPSKCGALSASSFVEPTEDNFKELIEGFEDIVKIITIAPEINEAIGLIKKMSGMGIIVSMGHSDATYNEAKAGFNAGAKGITHIFNAMRFHHREPGLAGFGLLNQDIYIELIADPCHLHSKTLELIFKTKNPDRIIIVSDTVKETKVRGGGGREQGITDIHGRLSGGCMTITESSKRLIEIGYNKNSIMRCITKNPKMYLSSF